MLSIEWFEINRAVEIAKEKFNVQLKSTVEENV